MDSASRTRIAAGTTHHAAIPRCASAAASARARTTPAATVQSSPTMKSYQNRQNPTMYLTASVSRAARRRQRPRAPLLEHRHQAQRGDQHEGEDAEDRQVVTRPRHARLLRAPEGAEGAEARAAAM